MSALLSSHILLLLLLVFLVVSVGSTVILGDDEGKDEDKDFFKRCPPSRCSRDDDDGPEVRYPLRLQSSPTSCGMRGLELSCSTSNQTILSLPYPGPYMVLAIDYQNSIITTKPLGSASATASQHPCPLQDLSSTSTGYGNTNGDILILTGYYNSANVRLVSCSKRFTPTSDEVDDLAGPISCLSGTDRFVYAANADSGIYTLPRDCRMRSTGGEIPYMYTFRDSVEAFDQGRVDKIKWITNGACHHCVPLGKGCGWRETGGFGETICVSFPPTAGTNVKLITGTNVKLITGTSIGGFLILLSVALILIYISRKSDKEKETRLKVEKFLAMYKATNPTRYTYASIKRITKRFKHKLGQGGFGSVYKGELANGIPVAVKMLEKSKGDGEEFTNEVATIGRIHHANIVRLLGFCSEGSRHALVYEFLPNESLEKFIFSKEVDRNCLSLSLEKLLEIAFGIAQGIEYLHQGCNERILHFDIKPHNILLDHDFNPKISDFGLAKLCSRDDSIVTMTAARGTMGYIAPEIYSRNFGTVSSKSDVYSFGMLVLEMVSGKKNVEPTIENQDEVYFPEWVYDRLVDGQGLGLITDGKGREEEIAKKLLVVALWCIQWNPIERPSMTKVIQMLMGNLESLQMPPKPFVSSSGQDKNTSLNVI